MADRDTADTNAAIWKSDAGISYWKSTSEDRERRRGEQRRLLADLLPFSDDDEFTVLDLGAGTGAAARTVLDRYRRAQAILADFSPQMMEQGKRELAGYEGRYRYVEFDLAEAGAWPADIPAGVEAVVSALSVHHVPDQRKQSLFGEILARLTPGGWYLNYDPVTAEDPAVEAAWQRAGDRRDPAAAAKRAHRTPEEQRRYENHVRYMSPLGPQLDFLRGAGFEAVDVYWKELDYVIYGGRRPAGPVRLSPGGSEGRRPAA
jgi:tRNA (cmo5U34)-methyltransferase